MPGPISAIQLAELAFTTQAYIDENPVTIVLTPSRGAPTKKPSGGHDYGTPTNRIPQTFRLIELPSPDGLEESKNDGGFVRKYGYQLVGMPTAIVEFGDIWDEVAPDNTMIHYHVDDVQPFNGWEVRAMVSAFATEPQHG